MDTADIPNWLRMTLRSILLMLSFLSFFPQLSLVFLRKDSPGISTYYTLFNLICATEQFTLGFFLVVNNINSPDVFVHDPVNTGDWLNLAQLIVVWIPWLIL